MAEPTDRSHPLFSLDDAEREFVLRLVLADGSLKQLAEDYGVSYPTIRAKLDRLVARIRELVQGRAPDPMSELLATFLERGEISSAAARKILELHRQEMKRTKEHRS